MQDYMDWLLFRKQLKYQVEGRRQKVESKISVMTKRNQTIMKELFKLSPIDLYSTDDESHFVIFANIY
jgi:hypothetical protein